MTSCSPPAKYMLDTVIFNRLLDGDIEIEHFPADGYLVATDLQRLEIENTKDSQRKNSLLSLFGRVTHGLESNSPVWGAMTWGRMQWPSSSADNILSRLQAQRSNSRYRKRKLQSDTMDSLIADAALLNGCRLLTCDSDLADIINQIAPGGALLISL